MIRFKQLRLGSGPLLRAMLIASSLLVTSCDGCEVELTPVESLEAVYTVGSGLVGKNTESMFDQNIQSGGYELLSGRAGAVSAARFGAFTFVGWYVLARDALGGAPLDKVFVAFTPGDVSDAEMLIEGGHHHHPALAVHDERLIAMWPSGRDVYLSSTSDANGQTWTTPVAVENPTGENIFRAIDIADHDGDLYLAAVIDDGGDTRLFAAEINMATTGDNFVFGTTYDDVVPTADPSLDHRVSLASNGTRLSLAYLADDSHRITHLEGGSWAAEEIIQVFSPPLQAGRPAIEYLDNYLYLCYPAGGDLKVRRRHETANNWDQEFSVNDAQASGSSIDCHKITVYR